MPDAPATPATPAATPAAVTPAVPAVPATPATPATPAVEAAPAVFDGPYDEARAATLITKLREENKAHAAKLAQHAEAERLRAEAEMTELQKVQSRAEAAEKALAAATAQTLVATLAAEFGVPAVLLTAADEAGLRAQAEAIKALLPVAGAPAATPAGRPAPAATPGTGGAPTTPLDAAAMADRIRSI